MFKLLFLILAVSAMTPTFAAMVMVLGDDQSEDDIVPYLESLGHTVNMPDVYYDWDPGLGADLSGYDSIVMLYGYDYGYGLTANASSALVSYINGGGNFITTAWLAYSDEDFAGDAFFDITPVEYDDEGYDAIWDIDESSPYFTGLSDGWSDNEGFEYLTITNPNAIALGSNQYGEPLVVFMDTMNGGRYSYLNHAMSYDTGSVSSEALTLVGNAVGLSASVPVPGTLALLGIAGLAAVGARRNRCLTGKAALVNS